MASEKVPAVPAVVVIVGAGFGGAIAAKTLDKDERFHVILVDLKGFFEYVPGTPALIENGQQPGKVADLLNTFVVPHDKYVENGEVVLGKVAEVNKEFSSVLLEDGRRIDFDYLIIGTGSSYPAPWKLPTEITAKTKDEYAARIESEAAKCKDAKAILVCGGGTVGIEVAGAILEGYPDKEVHFVSSTTELLLEGPVKLQKKAKYYFEHQDRCHLYLGEKISKTGDTYTTSVTKTEIKVDLVYQCYGAKPNSDLLQKHHLGHVNERKQIKVRPTLQLHDVDHVFAIGDCTDVNQSKTAKTAIAHGSHVAKCIQRMDSGKDLKNLPGEKPGMLVSFGNSTAVADLGAFTLVGWGQKGSRIGGFMKRQSWRFTSGKLL